MASETRCADQHETAARCAVVAKKFASSRRQFGPLVITLHFARRCHRRVLGMSRPGAYPPAEGPLTAGIDSGRPATMFINKDRSRLRDRILIFFSKDRWLIKDKGSLAARIACI